MIGVGDQVVTRRNDRTLRTDQGTTVRNRDHWNVQAIHPDRSVTITGPTGTVTLPADYATRNLEANHAYVVLEGNQTPTDLPNQAITREWVDQPAIAQQQQFRPADSRTSDRDAELDELVGQSIARAEAGRAHSRSTSLELGL